MRNQDLFEMTNIFNFGSPSLILDIASYLKPYFVFEGDTILRRGDVADEMFFIKMGRVEVLAEDE